MTEFDDTIIVTSPDVDDGTAYVRYSLAVAFFVGLSFAWISGVFLAYIKRRRSTDDRAVFDCDQHWCLFKYGLYMIRLAMVVLCLSSLLAVATGIAYLVKSSQRPPRVSFYAQGSPTTPCTWVINANGTSLSNVDRFEFDFGDGSPTLKTSQAYANHTYLLTPPLSTGQTVRVQVSAITRYSERSTNYVTFNLRNGYPQPVLTCRIVSTIPYAPSNISCDASTSFTKRKDRNITRWLYGLSGCGGAQAFVDFHSPVLPAFLAQHPGRCGIQLHAVDNTGLMSAAPVLFELNIPDGSPKVNMQLTFVDNIYQSVPLFVRWDVSQSVLVYPGAEWKRAVWSLPPSNQTLTFDIPAGSGPKLNTSVSILTRQMLKAGSYEVACTLIDTTGRRAAQTLSFRLVPPNPVVSLVYRTVHGGYTLERLTIDASGSRVNHPGRTLVSCDWSSPNLPAVDGQITKWPVATVNSGSAFLNDATVYLATVTLTDSAGDQSSLTIKMPVKSGTPQARFSASYDYFWSSCSSAYYNYDASRSYDPAPGHSLVKYKWYQDGRAQSTQSKNTWHDSYTRFPWARDITISLIVQTDQGVDSDSYPVQLNIAKNSCKQSDNNYHFDASSNRLWLFNLVATATLENPDQHQQWTLDVDRELTRHGVRRWYIANGNNNQTAHVVAEFATASQAMQLISLIDIDN